MTEDNQQILMGVGVLMILIAAAILLLIVLIELTTLPWAFPLWLLALGFIAIGVAIRDTRKKGP